MSVLIFYSDKSSVELFQRTFSASVIFPVKLVADPRSIRIDASTYVFKTRFPPFNSGKILTHCTTDAHEHSERQTKEEFKRVKKERDQTNQTENGKHTNVDENGNNVR